MVEIKRRGFMKRSAALVSGLALEGCAPSRPSGEESGATTALAPGTLEAVSRLVLPESELGEAGVGRVLDGFRKWLDELETVAELDHAYIWTDDILYGPHHPGPLWNAQLEALQIEAEKAHGLGFAELTRGDQESILKRQLPPGLGPSLPEPARAPHVALGLLAYFYQTGEANDLAYRKAIEQHTCRGIDSAPSEPGPKRS